MARWLSVCAIMLGLASNGISVGHPVIPGDARFPNWDEQEEPSEFWRGLFLLNELNCRPCHASSESQPLWQGLPARQAPILGGLRTRMRPDWLRHFLLDPGFAHPGTTMPNVLHDLTPSERGDAVEDLIHFLMSDPGRALPEIRFADVAFGERLYREVGCAACHGPDPLIAGLPLAAGFKPLPDLSRKYSLASLTEFLLDPRRYRPDGRMPGMGLKREEAADLAAYLMRYRIEFGERSDSFPADASRAERGRAIFARAGCAHCHAQTTPAARGSARPLLELDPAREGGCLQKPGPGCPDYSLSSDQVKALRAALGGLARRSTMPLEVRLSFQWRAFHCLACHQRDGRGGILEPAAEYLAGDELLGDAGKFPPPLTQIGRKLTGGWLTNVLQGSVRSRPYLRMRMPDYGGENLRSLPALLAEVDLAGRHPAMELKHAETKFLQAGRMLVGTEGGMGCITCHAWRDRPGLTMNALSLSTATSRLRADWFHDYLIDPGRYRPGTLMPSFWPDGVSTHPDVLNGETSQQIAALWRYLDEGSEPPAGYLDDLSSTYELVPRETSVVQRGFIAPAGTHAIAVGFPDGIHLAFDADLCRPVAMWRGRFLDAYKLWFSRLDPTGAPLGHDQRLWPDSFPLVRTDRAGETFRFRGYVLTGPMRIPEFQYASTSIMVRDRMEPTRTAHGFRRTLWVKSGQGTFTATLDPGQAEGLSVTILEPKNSVVVGPDQETMILLEYVWK